MADGSALPPVSRLEDWIQKTLAALWPNAQAGTPNMQNQYAVGYLDGLQAFAAALRVGPPPEPSEPEPIEQFQSAYEAAEAAYHDNAGNHYSALRAAVEAALRWGGPPREPTEEAVEAFREECMRRGVGTKRDARDCLRAAYAVDFRASRGAPQEGT